MKPALLKRVGAEAFGTFSLVIAGCGAIMVDALSQSLTHVGVAFTFGLVIMAMIAAIGHISGAHFNPAVTIAFALGRHFPWREVIGYISGQMIGGVAASFTLLWLFGNIADLGATVPSGNPWQSFGLEIVLTAILMFVITSVATDARAIGGMAAIAIGATVAFEALFGGPISGASMNPARSLGPALVSGIWVYQWIYIAAPVIGASIGVSLYQLIRE